MSKYVYAFAEGSRDMEALLGGKSANLAEMTGLGLPVPPGFILTTEAYRAYPARRLAGDAPLGDRQHGRRRAPAGVMRHADAVRRLEVRAIADTPQDAERARRFGAQGPAPGACSPRHRGRWALGGNARRGTA